jgi:hypothetical protein
MRRCFIHVGTHKTGTTSLQYALSTRSQKLEGFGFYYPRLGRPSVAPHAHHNFAWEISKDDRFQKASGSIDDLLAEVADVPHNVILSSEDFECSAHHPEQFTSFIERLKERQFEVIFIVYFRNQIEYAESLYLTMLLFGLDIPFAKYIAEILENGRFRWHHWIFAFDYDEFATRLRRIDGVELIVRSYDTLAKGALVSDFLAILGLRPNDMEIVEDIYLNERCSMSQAIELFYRNRVRRPLLSQEQAALTSLFPHAAAPVEMKSKHELIERFAASNRRLINNYGIGEFKCILPERMGMEFGKRMSMEDIFSTELCDAVGEKLKSAYGRDADLNEPG